MTKDQAKQLLECPKFKAFAEGKKMEWLGDQWVSIDNLDSFHFLHKADHIRIVPTPVPPGDLTCEEASELHKKGVKLQFLSKVTDTWESCDGCDFLDQGYAYRIAPEKKRVPLEAKDVPPGSAVRMKGNPTWAMITSIGEYGINWGDIGHYSWQRLIDEDCEISRDNGKTWSGCWKEVES